MRLKSYVLVALVAAFSLFLGASGASAAGFSPAEAGLLNAVNATRAAHGLQPVRFDPALERAARANSTDMLRTSSFAHGAFARRLHAFGAHGPFLGENLAWGAGSFGAASTVIQAWLTSPAHRANLLRPGFERIGISALRGTFKGYGDAIVITADFGGH